MKKVGIISCDKWMNKITEDLLLKQELMNNNRFLVIKFAKFYKKIIGVNTSLDEDDLVQAGVHSINPGFSIKTISSAVSNSVGFALNEGFPNIIKLHGDYLFDKLKNI